MGLATVISALLLATGFLGFGSAFPTYQNSSSSIGGNRTSVNDQPSSWWFAQIKREGRAVYAPEGYKVFRNVKDYGAAGDGTTDDTNAINAAMADGDRCFWNCDSQTSTPALVYFPPGTYLVSAPLIPLYYTHMVGDLVSPPTLKASAGFQGIAVIDANPYGPSGNAWTNQNNFFRQVRNFVIDLTAQPPTTGTGIHWQVAQATSLQNIVFNMRTDGGSSNVQQGLFIENGSGGFMTDLTFNGGHYGMFVGSQQFTTRNLKFNNCNTAVFLNWDWVWTFHGLEINNCRVGINMASGASSGAQSVGSMLLLDSVIANTQVGVVTAYDPGSPWTNGSLLIDNVDMSSTPIAVRHELTEATLLQGNTRIASWAQGKAYAGPGASRGIQGPIPTIQRPASLVDTQGRFVTRSKPQYVEYPAAAFLHAKDNGCAGDGVTDDTAAIQALFDRARPDQVVYFDHGAYIITDTIRVPKNIKIVGEIWPLLLASGNANFKDQNNPKPVFRVGEPGDVGNVEMIDLMIETKGPQPGAILMEWNIAGTRPGDAGLWDVHFRIGGTAGTDLQSDRCAKTPEVETQPNPECLGAWLLTHLTEQSSGYFENVWWWVSDHELDIPGWQQINIYNGRGVLIESTKGAWFWGTASEHSVLYNYQFHGARDVFLGHIQTETAYMQGNPDALVPFTVNAVYNDPDFAAYCAAHAIQPDRCPRTWGLRAIDSQGIFLYGAGMYSFFDNYAQECVPLNNCQDHMTSLEGDTDVRFFGVSTKAAVSMITVEGEPVALDVDNRNNFCATLVTFEL